MACTIAHELDHFITNDQFEDNLKANKEIHSIEVEEKKKTEKEIKEEKEKLITSRISRLSEVDADKIVLPK